MGIGMILLWLVPIVLLVWLFVRMVGGMGDADASCRRSPREILDARYARGKIDRDEYQRRRADLE